MPEQLSEADVAAIRELIPAARLTSMDTYELSARRAADEPAAADLESGSIEVDVASHIEEAAFGFRITATITMPIGEVIASVAGEYEIANGVTPTRRTVQQFGNEVAIMSIYPYVREAVSSITAKVFGEPLLMPVVERGQIAVEVDDE